MLCRNQRERAYQTYGTSEIQMTGCHTMSCHKCLFNSRCTPYVRDLFGPAVSRYLPERFQILTVAGEPVDLKLLLATVLDVSLNTLIFSFKHFHTLQAFKFTESSKLGLQLVQMRCT